MIKDVAGNWGRWLPCTLYLKADPLEPERSKETGPQERKVRTRRIYCLYPFWAKNWKAELVSKVGMSEVLGEKKIWEKSLNSVETFVQIGIKLDEKKRDWGGCKDLHNYDFLSLYISKMLSYSVTNRWDPPTSHLLPTHPLYLEACYENITYHTQKR